MKLRHFPFPSKSKWKWRLELNKCSDNFTFPSASVKKNSSSCLCLSTMSLLFLLTFVMTESWAELVVNEAELERPPSKKKSSEEFSHPEPQPQLDPVLKDRNVNPDTENNRMVRENEKFDNPPVNQHRLASENMNLLFQRESDLGGDPPNVAHGPFSPDTCCITSGENCHTLCVPDSSDESCGCVFKQRWGYCQWRCQDLVGGDPNDIALDEDADPILDAVTYQPNTGGAGPSQPGEEDYYDENYTGSPIEMRRSGFSGRGRSSGGSRSRGGGHSRSKISQTYQDILETPHQRSRTRGRSRSQSRSRSHSKKGHNFNRDRGIYSVGAVHSDSAPDPGAAPGGKYLLLSKPSKSNSRSNFEDLLK